MSVHRHYSSRHTRCLWYGVEPRLASKVEGYFSSDWSHLWSPSKGIPNQIKVLREPQMKYNVSQLDGKNELVNSVLGNYFIELELGNVQAK